MSRSTHHVKVGRNWRHRWRFMRRAQSKAARRLTHAFLDLELRLPSEDDLEVQADAEEEAGRYHMARRLRQGHDLPRLPS